MRSTNRRAFRAISLIAVFILAIVFRYGRDFSRREIPGDPVPPAADVETGRFKICARERYHCVVDGDTFVLDGVTVRMADIDAPEIGGARCEYERKLGLRAKSRLVELLNEGPFRLEPIDRDVDRYGRKLRVVMRDGHSLGDDLIKEGLARRWDGGKKPWC
jgi:endonuclease YncB( thermonuclease family)